MKCKLFPGFASLLLIAACSSQDMKLNLTPSDDARTACRTAHPAIKGNFVVLAKCLNNVDDKYDRPSDPDVDLLNKLETTRSALAADVDAGQITVDDYNEQINQLETQITAEKHRRSTERARSNWGISHGLDPASKDVNPLPVVPPG